jgi:hypothetical protein
MYVKFPDYENDFSQRCSYCQNLWEGCSDCGVYGDSCSRCYQASFLNSPQNGFYIESMYNAALGYEPYEGDCTDSAICNVFDADNIFQRLTSISVSFDNLYDAYYMPEVLSTLNYNSGTIESTETEGLFHHAQ